MIDPISRPEILASWDRSYQARFAPWSKMPPEEWAEEIYRLPDGRRFRWDYAPYARGMFRSLFDKKTIETAFQMYSRGLKSTVVLLAIGYVIDQAPRRILSLWPTNSQAEKWSKDILCGELFNTTPCLHALGNTTGKRIASNTLLHKAFPGGLIDMFGANAPGDMRRAKGSFLYGDEIDAIGTEITDEGDQLAIFNKRGDEYPDTIRVFASYPGVLGASRISKKLDDSDGNQWHSTCLVCGGEPFVMHRKQIIFDADKPELAMLECPRCKAHLNDAQRYEMAHRQGYENWVPARPFRGKRGFQGNAMLWPHPVDRDKFPGGWLQCLAQQQIDAERSENPKRSMRVLVNTVDAEPFDPTEENEKPPDWKVLYERREDYGLTVPVGGLFLTAFVDCQKNRLEVGWRAQGRADESWGMDYQTVPGFVGDPETWVDLAMELSREWTHATGADMHLGFGFIDGGAYSDDVYRFFQLIAAYFSGEHPLHRAARVQFKKVSEERMRRIYGHIQASKGVGSHPHPFVTRGKLSTVAKSLKGRYIGTWQCKDRIYERLRMVLIDGKIPEGYMHFNKQYPEEYFQGLTIETATQKIDGDQVYNTYKDEVSGNEPLDIEVGCLAALRLHPRNWDIMEAELQESANAKKTGVPVVENTMAILSVGGSKW